MKRAFSDDAPFGLWAFAARLCITIPTIAAVGGSVASAVIGGNAAQSAADTQAAAANSAQQNTRQMYEETRGDLAPFRDIGTAANNNYLALLGAGPNGQSGIMSALAQTPGYQFTLQQGQQAVQNSMAAQGLGVSGAALKAGANYAEGLAGTTYQSVLGNYYNAMGLGETAAAQTGALGATYTGQANQAITAAGAASAAGQIGAANATIGGINNATGALSNAMMMSNFYGGNQGNIFTLPSASWG